MLNKNLTDTLIQHLSSGNLRAAIACLSQGADPNVQTSNGATAMHIAAGVSIDTLSLLIKNGGNPNVRSDDGSTPMHVAAAWGKMDSLRFLLQNGADPHLRDHDSNMAVDLAQNEGHSACADMLMYYGMLISSKPAILETFTSTQMHEVIPSVDCSLAVCRPWSNLLTCGKTDVLPSRPSDHTPGCAGDCSKAMGIYEGNEQSGIERVDGVSIYAGTSLYGPPPNCGDGGKLIFSSKKTMQSLSWTGNCKWDHGVNGFLDVCDGVGGVEKAGDVPCDCVVRTANGARVPSGRLDSINTSRCRHNSPLNVGDVVGGSSSLDIHHYGGGAAAARYFPPIVADVGEMVSSVGGECSSPADRTLTGSETFVTCDCATDPEFDTTLSPGSGTSAPDCSVFPPSGRVFTADRIASVTDHSLSDTTMPSINYTSAIPNVTEEVLCSNVVQSRLCHKGLFLDVSECDQPKITVSATQVRVCSGNHSGCRQWLPPASDFLDSSDLMTLDGSFIAHQNDRDRTARCSVRNVSDWLEKLSVEDGWLQCQDSMSANHDGCLPGDMHDTSLLNESSSTIHEVFYRDPVNGIELIERHVMSDFESSLYSQLHDVSATSVCNKMEPCSQLHPEIAPGGDNLPITDIFRHIRMPNNEGSVRYRDVEEETEPIVICDSFCGVDVSTSPNGYKNAGKASGQAFGEALCDGAGDCGRQTPVSRELSIDKKVLDTVLDLACLSNEAIFKWLKKLGHNPGPILPSTRQTYLQQLVRLIGKERLTPMQSIPSFPESVEQEEQLRDEVETVMELTYLSDRVGAGAGCVTAVTVRTRCGWVGISTFAYSPELQSLLSSSLQLDEMAATERVMVSQFQTPDGQVWREGTIKSCFNYLLLDPRLTRNLPLRAPFMNGMDAFRTFLSAAFYIGKGTQSRPYCHLYEAISHFKKPLTKASRKVSQIMDIWSENVGVVSLHCFQNVIPVEAYTREACMVDAIGMSDAVQLAGSPILLLVRSTAQNSPLSRRSVIYLR